MGVSRSNSCQVVSEQLLVYMHVLRPAGKAAADMSFARLMRDFTIPAYLPLGFLNAYCAAGPTESPHHRWYECVTQALTLLLLLYVLMQAEVSQTLCCLAIPADMSVANFCTFIGAYLGEVRSMQVGQLQAAPQQLHTAYSTAVAQPTTQQLHTVAGRATSAYICNACHFRC